MYRKLLTCLGIVLCMVALGYSAELVGPEQVQVGQSFDVTVKGLSLDLSIFAEGQTPPQIEWKLVSGEGTIRPRMEVLVEMDTATNKPKWVISPYATAILNKQGKIAIVLMVVKNGIGELLVHEVTVGPFPDPEPDPEPTPNEELWGAVLIEESAERPWQLAAILTSQKLETFYQQNNLVWSVSDQHTDSEDMVPYIEQAEQKGLPTLFLVGKKGAIFYKGPVPTTVDKVLELTKQYMKEDKQ